MCRHLTLRLGFALILLVLGCVLSAPGPVLTGQAKLVSPILADPECLAACDAENENCLAAGIPALQCAKATLRCKQRCTLFPGGF